MSRVEAVVIATNDHQYVIDKGSHDGVVVGMRFAILGPQLPNKSGRLVSKVEVTAEPVKQVAKAIDVAPTQSTIKTFRSTRKIIERGLVYLSTPVAAKILAPEMNIMKRSKLGVWPISSSVILWLTGAIIRYLRDRRNLIPRMGDRVVQIIGDEAQEHASESTT